MKPWCSRQTDNIRAQGPTKSVTVFDISLFSDIKKRKPFFCCSNDHSFWIPSLFFFLLGSFLHVVQNYVLWHNEVFDESSRRLTKQKACSDGNTRYVFVLWKIPLLSLSSRPPAVTIHLFSVLYNTDNSNGLFHEIWSGLRCNTHVNVLASFRFPPCFLFIHTDLKPTFLLCRRDESLVVVFRQSESAKISMNAKSGFHLHVMRSPSEANQDQK